VFREAVFKVSGVPDIAFFRLVYGFQNIGIEHKAPLFVSITSFFELCSTPGAVSYLLRRIFVLLYAVKDKWPAGSP
jgi:hypothetical protein